MANDIAVIGLACRFPGDASDERKFLELLKKRKSAFSEVPKARYNVDAFHREGSTHVGDLIARGGHYLTQNVSAFDAPFFGISAEEARAMDPAARMLLENTYEAFENAGIPMEVLKGSNTGCYVGCFTKDYHELLMADPEAAPMYSGTGTGFSLLANRISWYYDLRGASMSLDTACSSSLVGLHLACQSLRSGESEMALVSGANLILAANLSLWLSNLHMVSPEGLSRAFAHDVKGYGRGEGIASIVLKPLKSAIRDGDNIRAVIKGTGVNQDGRTSSITVPNPQAQSDLIRSTYRAAALDFADVGYFEAHGTGTAVGDTSELLAISRVMKECKRAKPLLVGSVKSNIGHLEGAAGVAGIVKSILMLENGIILPNIHLDRLNSEIPFGDYNIEIPTELRPWPKDTDRRISVNSFGYGGTNAHVILEAFPMTPQGTVIQEVDLAAHDTSSQSPKIFAFSGHTSSSVARTRERYLDYVSKKEHWRDAARAFDNLAYTLASRRSHLSYRSFHIASSFAELRDSLSEGNKTPVRALRDARIGFVFTGQGAQWPGMGQELMQYPIFRESVERAQEFLLIQCRCSWNLIEEWKKPHKVSRIGSPEVAQPLCTVIQIAMVDLVRSWGITPVAVVGHSSGEIAAAYCAGALSEIASWQIAFHRGRLCQELLSREPRVKGAMVAVGAGMEVLKPYLDSLTAPGHANAACLNSPLSVTVSGDTEKINELYVKLQGDGIFARKLAVEVAYHSPHMQAVAGAYLKSISHVVTAATCHKEGVRMFSSVTGKQAGLSELTPEYWARNLVSPVLFSDAVSTMLSTAGDRSNNKSTSVDLLLEIGPHSTLKGPIQQIMSDGKRGTVGYASLIERNRDAARNAMTVASELHILGVPVDISAVNQVTDGSKVMSDLPGYPWDRSQQYWAVSRLTKSVLHRKQPRHDLLGAEMPGSDRLHASWRYFPNRHPDSWIKDHVVHGSTVYPAAAFLIMAIEAVLQLRQADRPVSGVHLKQVRVLKALVVSPEEADTELITRVWQTNFSQEKEPGSWNFSISCTQGVGGVEEHVTGSVYIQYEQNDSFGASGSEMIFKSKLGEYHELLSSETCGSDPETFYKTIKAAGITYGPRFQLISEVSSGPGACCFKIATPQRKEGESAYVIHPTTLDSVIHTIFAALSRVDDLKTAAMPVTFGHVFVSTVSSQSTLTGSKDISGFTTAVRSEPRQVVADIFCFSSDSSRILVQIEDLQCTEVPAQPEKAKDERAAPLGSVVWKPDIAFISDNDLLEFALDGSDGDSLAASWSRSDRTAVERIIGLAAFKHPTLSILQLGSNTLSMTNVMNSMDEHNMAGVAGASRISITVLDEASAIPLDALSDARSGTYNIRRLPFDPAKPLSANAGEGNSFDIVVITYSMAQSNAEWQRLCTESISVLKAGGRLLRIEPEHGGLRAHNELAFINGTANPTTVDSWSSTTIQSDKQEESTRLSLYSKRPHPRVIPSKVHIIYPPGLQEVAAKLRQRLPGLLVEEVAWPPNDVSLHGSFVISLMELGQTFLSSMSSGDFTIIQSMALHCERLLWVCSGDDPHMGVAQGWLRVLQNENPGISYQYLALDGLETMNIDAQAATITSVATSESEEREFASVDGQLTIPRWTYDSELSRVTSHRGELVPLTKAWPKDLRPRGAVKMALSENLDEAHFVLDTAAESLLLEDEISVEIDALVLTDADLKLPESPTLREGTGIVSAVGDGVDRFIRGDCVSFFFNGHLSGRAVVKSHHCQKLPGTMPTTDAALLAVTFATAIRAEASVAHLQHDDLILVHGAGSGVGRAITFLLIKSGRSPLIFTAKTREEATAIARLGVPSTDIFSERDQNLWSAIRAMTRNRGLGALIYSSASEEGIRSLAQCLSPTGLLINTSKMVPGTTDAKGEPPHRDRVGNHEFVTEDQLITSNFASHYPNELAPLFKLYKSFPACDLAKALEHKRQKGLHEGTILTFHNDGEDALAARTESGPILADQATYILAGGLGGLGRSLAKFLVSNGARNIVVLSRSGPNSSAARSITEDLTGLGINTAIYTCDIGNAESLAAALTHCQQTMPPIRGVIQSAAVIRDAIFDNYSHEDWRANLHPKVQGSWNLHCQLPKTLDFFIMLGSISGVIGHRSQAGYASGNTFQDSLSYYRRKQGLPSITIDLGAMADVGMINDGTAAASLSTSEVVWMKEAELERIMTLCIQCTPGLKIPAQICTGLPSGGILQSTWESPPLYFERPFFAALKHFGVSNLIEDPTATLTHAKENMTERLRNAKTPDAVLSCVKESLLARLANDFGITPEEIDLSETLATYGVDSLKVLDLRNWIRQTLKAQLSFFQILDTSKSIWDLIGCIVEVSDITAGLRVKAE